MNGSRTPDFEELLGTIRFMAKNSGLETVHVALASADGEFQFLAVTDSFRGQLAGYIKEGFSALGLLGD